MKDKIKQISKYVMNIMAFIDAILTALSPVWGWNIDKITDSMTILVGLIGAWLVSGKIFGDKDNYNKPRTLQEALNDEGE